MRPLCAIRLLIVEDDPGYRYLIETAFRRHRGEFRWELAIAADGEQALNLLFEEEKARTSLPDLILLDWHLPKVSGNEVLRRIKEHRRLCRIPVLIFSSSDADKDINAAYDNHANGYLKKPADGGVMEAIVDAMGQFWVSIARLPKVAQRDIYDDAH